MNCPTCGKVNRDTARFCRYCGTLLVEPSVEPPEPTPEEMPQGKEAVIAGDEKQLYPEEPAPAGEAEEEQPDAQSPTIKEAEASEELPLEPDKEEPVSEATLPETEEENLAQERQEKGDVISFDSEGTTSEAGEPVFEPEETPVELPQAEEDETVPPPPPTLDEEEVDDEPLAEIDEEVFSFWREEEEPLMASPPGTVLADRYLVVEVLDDQEHEILYHAQDLQCCWQCGFEGNAPDEAFCKMCGASLDRKLPVRLLEVQAPESEPSSGEEVLARLTHQERTFLLLTKPKPEMTATVPSESMCLVVGQRSDAGQVRGLNEDSLLSLVLAPTYEGRKSPVLGLFALADGMGGHAGGEVASKLALQVLFDHVMRTIIMPEMSHDMMLEGDVVARMRQATIAANDAVYLARQKGDSDMGTTLTSVLVRNDLLFLAHVGDSRAYRWNADGLEQLTTDHSVVASMIASGQAAPEEIYTHPHRSVIYRCIGDKPLVEVDVYALPLAIGDRLILCSDGLWEEIRDEGMEDVMMQEADPQSACELLVHRANVAGGEDNISVIVIQAKTV
jgi:serine/threonine protein phosphatase PrpC